MHGEAAGIALETFIEHQTAETERPGRRVPFGDLRRRNKKGQVLLERANRERRGHGDTGENQPDQQHSLSARRHSSCLTVGFLETRLSVEDALARSRAFWCVQRAHQALKSTTASVIP